MIDPALYNIFYPVSFNGSNLTNTSSECIVIGSGVRLRCLNGNSKLVDGNIGTIELYIWEFFAFSRHSVVGIGRITFNFYLNTPVSRAVIYFFNSPNNSIGLPMISLYREGSQPLSYVFDNNDDLRQSDSQLRNVTLNIQQSTTVVQLDFIFNTSIIDWLLVSEVKFYNGKFIHKILIIINTLSYTRHSNTSLIGHHYLPGWSPTNCDHRTGQPSVFSQSLLYSSQCWLL